jgi:hypothetical protein
MLLLLSLPLLLLSLLLDSRITMRRFLCLMWILGSFSGRAAVESLLASGLVLASLLLLPSLLSLPLLLVVTS